MPFLPPECLNAVVLQATLGHTGRIWIRPRSVAEPYRRSPDEFRQHAREVAALWGRRLLQSRTIFLAGSDVLRLPEADVQEYLTVIGEVFPIEAGASETEPRSNARWRRAVRDSRASTFSWMTFGPASPDRTAWTALAALGLCA